MEYHLDHRYFSELIGIAAAAASLYAAHARTIIPLRIAAIVANSLAMSYSFLHGTYPTFALNAILLPLNDWRLRSMLHLVRDIDVATKSDMNVDWLLPYTRPDAFQRRRCDHASRRLCYCCLLHRLGEIEMVEINTTLGKGTLVGEIGLFAPDGKRTMTIRCKTNVQAAQIDYDRFKEPHFQNPQFGFRRAPDRCAHAKQPRAVAAGRFHVMR